MNSQYKISSSAFITETDAQDFVLKGATADQRVADAIVRGINWGANIMARYTGRRLRNRAYTAPRTGLNCGTAGGNLTPLDSTATAALKAALVGEPVYGSSLDPYTTVKTAWDGSKVVLSQSPTGSTADLITIGDGRLVVDGKNHMLIQLPEWPLTTLIGLYLVSVDGTRSPIDYASNSIISYETGEITLGVGYFTHWDDEWMRGRIEIECFAGYLAPSGYAAGHPEHWEVLAQVNRDLAQLYFQRRQTPGGHMTNAGGIGATGTFNDDRLPNSITAQLDPFMRMGR